MKKEIFLCLAQAYVFPPELMFWVCLFICFFSFSKLFQLGIQYTFLERTKLCQC